MPSRSASKQPSTQRRCSKQDGSKQGENRQTLLLATDGGRGDFQRWRGAKSGGGEGNPGAAARTIPGGRGGCALDLVRAAAVSLPSPPPPSSHRDL
jgi:hypothetical protein